MNLEKIYHDVNGNECNIFQLTIREPEWAANIIQLYEQQLSAKDLRLVEATAIIKELYDAENAVYAHMREYLRKAEGK